MNRKLPSSSFQKAESDRLGRIAKNHVQSAALLTKPQPPCGQWVLWVNVMKPETTSLRKCLIPYSNCVATCYRPLESPWFMPLAILMSYKHKMRKARHLFRKILCFYFFYFLDYSVPNAVANILTKVRFDPLGAVLHSLLLSKMPI